jgi:[ribosomal protein S5]-alanine N-acetyltransferase
MMAASSWATWRSPPAPKQEPPTQVERRRARYPRVLVDEDEKVVGRFNLYDLVDGTGEVGYRVAQRLAGRGVATSALQDLCRIAREQYGLRTLRAATSNDNVASQRVLTKVGFVATGPAEVGGRQGSRYKLALTPATRDRS